MQNPYNSDFTVHTEVISVWTVFFVTGRFRYLGLILLIIAAVWLIGSNGDLDAWFSHIPFSVNVTTWIETIVVSFESALLDAVNFQKAKDYIQTLLPVLERMTTGLLSAVDVELSECFSPAEYLLQHDLENVSISEAAYQSLQIFLKIFMR